MKKTIVVLTGAGISAESGLKTFRDSDGLWNGYNINEVATPQAFANNPQLVLDFYNMRRQDVAAAKPNAAHYALAEMEQHFNLHIITQNIDDLHERAGSTMVLHLHGEITKMRSVKNYNKRYSYNKDLKVGDVDEDGNQLRPHIVWFNEDVPMMEPAAALAATADIFVVIGTSLQVYPAASLLHYAPPQAPIFLIDKSDVSVKNTANLTIIKQPATIGVALLKEQLLKL
jgi:NAD-dependent deacetylase